MIKANILYLFVVVLEIQLYSKYRFKSLLLLFIFSFGCFSFKTVFLSWIGFQLSFLQSSEDELTFLGNFVTYNSTILKAWEKPFEADFL